MSIETGRKVVRTQCGRWQGLPAWLVLLGFVVGGGLSAHAAVQARRLTEARAVFLGLGDVIDRAHIAVGTQFNRDRYLNKVTLVLTLVEQRTSGVQIVLGEFVELLGDTLLVTSTNGPDGRWLVEMAVGPTTSIQ